MCRRGDGTRRRSRAVQRLVTTRLRLEPNPSTRQILIWMGCIVISGVLWSSDRDSDFRDRGSLIGHEAGVSKRLRRGIPRFKRRTPRWLRASSRDNRGEPMGRSVEERVSTCSYAALIAAFSSATYLSGAKHSKSLITEQQTEDSPIHGYADFPRDDPSWRPQKNKE